MPPGPDELDIDSWCGACRPDTRTVYGEPCDQCHPAQLRGRVPTRHCGECARDSRLLSDGTRCPRCHPFADYGIDRYAVKPWCGRCDKHDNRHEIIGGYRFKCRRCHPLGRKPMQWPTFEIPSGFIEQFLACDWLCFVSPTLRRVGPDRLRMLLRRWFDADYTPKDIIYALDHLPTGELHETRTPTPSEKPQVIETWVVRRLRQWLDLDEEPLPPVNSHIRLRRNQVLAEQQSRRLEYDRLRELAADPQVTPGAARARVVASTAVSINRRTRAAAHERELAAYRQRRSEEQALCADYDRRLRELSVDDGRRAAG